MLQEAHTSIVQPHTVPPTLMKLSGGSRHFCPPEGHTPAKPAYGLQRIPRHTSEHHGDLTRENAGMKEGKQMRPPTTQLLGRLLLVHKPVMA
jgi:hypothetical protein